MSKNFTDKLSYCGQQTYKNDYDRFILSLCVPSQFREALWALFSLNYEVSKTKEVVTEPMLGKMRLQWWLDAIAEIYEGKIREHEVLSSLSLHINEYSLPKELIADLITSRNIEFESPSIKTRDDLFSYAGMTTSPLHKLCLIVLNETLNEKDLETLSVCYSLLGTIRSTHYLAICNLCLLPQDILNLYDLSARDIINFNPENEKAISAVIKEISDIIAIKLNDISTHTFFSRKLEKLIRSYLKFIAKCDYNPFHPRFADYVPFLYIKLLI
jgi:phytoene synthase